MRVNDTFSRPAVLLSLCSSCDKVTDGNMDVDMAWRRKRPIEVSATFMSCLLPEISDEPRHQIIHYEYTNTSMIVRSVVVVGMVRSTSKVFKYSSKTLHIAHLNAVGKVRPGPIVAPQSTSPAKTGRPLVG